MSAQKTHNKPTEEVWDKAWTFYNKKPYFKPNHKVLDVISRCFGGRLGGKKIVELGAGSGSDIICLAQKGVNAYAIDFSIESLNSIKYWAKKKGVTVKTVQADIKKIPYPSNSFDMVYSVGLMEHFTNPIVYLREQIRVVKPGGFLLVDVPQKYTLYTLAKHLRMKIKTHPFGWETEFSKANLAKIAYRLGQSVYKIYGREWDVNTRLPRFVQHTCGKLYTRFIERSLLGPYTSLAIGLIIQVRKN